MQTRLLTLSGQRAAAALLLLFAVPLNGDEPRVAGLHELVVINPETHRNGVPGVVLDDRDSRGMVVEIPPAIHIHRFYYSGDREFQGPTVIGGPTLIVAGHPKTGERVYAEVTLPPGVPTIAHDKRAINYIYNDRRVSVVFASTRDGQVTVKYHSGQGLRRRLGQMRRNAVSSTVNHMRQSPLLGSVKESLSESGRVLTGARDGIEAATASALDSIRSIVDSMPGVAALKSYATDRAERRYQSTIDRAARERSAAAIDRVRTIR